MLMDIIFQFIVRQPLTPISSGSSPNRERNFPENELSPLLGGVPRSGEGVV